MTYRKIDVDGETYEYTIGETHVKIKGYEAVLKEDVVSYTFNPPTGIDAEIEVRPKHLRAYILNNSLRISN